MKYDQAYCTSLEDKLTIYEVRDLNFDESDNFDSDESDFLCPDDLCREMVGEKSKLSVVNAKRRKYVKTPHFRDTVNTLHREKCPYGNPDQVTDDVAPESTHTEGVKEHHFPTEFIPKRKRYTKKAPKKPLDGREGVEATVSRTNPTTNLSRGKSTNKTSVLEHIVECYVSNINDKKKLNSMPLTISGIKLSYWSFFKKIRYFEDREGLIYWGQVKSIKDYKFSFRVDFADWVRGKPVSLYIKKSLIDSYRKRKMFLDEIRDVIQSDDEKYCFFYGIYPQVKEVKYGDKAFHVYNGEVENIDHILIRTIHP